MTTPGGHALCAGCYNCSKHVFFINIKQHLSHGQARSGLRSYVMMGSHQTAMDVEVTAKYGVKSFPAHTSNLTWGWRGWNSYPRCGVSVMEVCDCLLVLPVFQNCVIETVALCTNVLVHHNTGGSTRLDTKKSYPAILRQVRHAVAVSKACFPVTTARILQMVCGSVREDCLVTGADI